MKTPRKRIQLEKAKLFGFNQPASGKAQSKSAFAKPMIGTKTVGAKPVAQRAS